MEGTCWCVTRLIGCPPFFSEVYGNYGPRPYCLREVDGWLGNYFSWVKPMLVRVSRSLFVCEKRKEADSSGLARDSSCEVYREIK